MQQTRIALVEIGRSHDECMFAQINALKSIDAEIYLVADSQVASRLTAFHTFKDVYEVNTTGAAIGDFRKMRAIANYLKINKIDKVVFNTAQGGHIRNLRFLVSKAIDCYGIVHTIKKFNQSKTQKIIHKFIKKYAVLSDILKEGISKEYQSKVETYYPIEFPKTEKSSLKKEDDIWITIPGGVETRRKDIDAIQTLIEQTPEHVKFVFAGKTDLNRDNIGNFKEIIQKAQYASRIIYFEDFLNNETFYSLIASSDFLMPLIHPNTPSADEYPLNQISGSFNLAFAYRIPLLMHKEYQNLVDLKESAFFYAIKSFSETFAIAVKERTNCVGRIVENPKWALEFQRHKFLRFLDINPE